MKVRKMVSFGLRSVGCALSNVGSYTKRWVVGNSRARSQIGEYIGESALARALISRELLLLLVPSS